MSRTVEDIRGEMERVRKERETPDREHNAQLLALRAELEVAARAQFGAATCPRRMAGIGPWAVEENLDWWEPGKNGERSCSFCGSMHPEDFDRHLDRVIAEPANDKVRISMADGRHKFYVERPEVRNACEGPIKFYSAHALPDWFPVDSPASIKLTRAARLSEAKFTRHLEELPGGSRWTPPNPTGPV